MRKLKRISDGKVFDCTIVIDIHTTCCVYYEDGIWKRENLNNFKPAKSGRDY